MTFRICTPLSALCCALLLPVAAAANTLEGTWLTEPDRHGVVAHVEARPCGDATCGVITRAFDPSGREVTSPNIGKRVFWDMKPAGDGTYEGRAYVPAHGRSYNGVIRTSGSTAKVSGCLGPICMGQTWQKVH